jgi:hypothetical protein
MHDLDGNSWVDLRLASYYQAIVVELVRYTSRDFMQI